MASETIRIRGARVHNLRNVDLDIPRGQLVVLTGPSGSGKSSLAFDTLFAEGQRQYIESLSVHARHFLRQLERPDVDLVDGLQPTVCIDQRPGATNPRSTVGTVTELYDYLRLLMARLGEASCPACGCPIRPQSPEEIQRQVLSLPEGTKAMILAPLVRARRGAHEEALAAIRKAGLVRVRIDGELYELDAAPPLDPHVAHDIDAVVDRVILRPTLGERLGDSLRLALQHGEGRLVLCHLDESAAEPAGSAAATGRGKWRDQLFSTLHACPSCGASFEALEPRSFSFNSPYGACESCDGLGVVEQFDLDLVAPDRGLSLRDKVLAPWRDSPAATWRKVEQELAPFLARHTDLAWDTPLESAPGEAVERLWTGDGEFPGVLSWLEREYELAVSASSRPTRRAAASKEGSSKGSTPAARLERLRTFRDRVVCGACGGSRLKPAAACVRLGGLAIHELTRLNVGAIRQHLAGLTFAAADEAVAEPLLRELDSRLAFLERVGADYLTLDRAADTLSGGELQRVRLATSIGSGLVGVCYILDEPSIGLHPRDNARLIESIRDLRREGNTVIAVEHDEALMREADLLIDIGPGAGAHGGRVVAQGTVAELCQHPESPTGAYLAGRARLERPAERRPLAKARSLQLLGASANNLRDLDVRIPLGALVCVTGVSGSGKSTLINETLARAVRRRLGGGGPRPGAHRGLRGVSQLDKLVEIDQTPLGRSPRSNAATYCGVFDEIRKVYAGLPDSKRLGYRANRFSFNVAGGRCEECQGQGVRVIEMHFLADVHALCPTCRGARFNRQTLRVRYKGRSIADVLAMPIEEAREFFQNFPVVSRPLVALDEIGLGYLPLGQSATSLSGGEAQRVKLGTELARTETGRTLYVLDEPTTGLHFGDIQCLLRALQGLVERGNTVVVIEHHLDVVRAADWIIDLGPEGGSGGGQLVAEGTPEQVAAVEASHTGQFLLRGDM